MVHLWSGLDVPIIKLNGVSRGNDALAFQLISPCLVVGCNEKLPIGEMTRQKSGEFLKMEADVKAIAARVKDVIRFLCPECQEVLKKVATFRETLSGTA